MTQSTPVSFLSRIFNRLKRYFFTGILVLLPLYISVFVLFFVFRFVDGIWGKVLNVYFNKHFGFYIPGLGLILFLLIFIFAGIVSTHYFSKRYHSILYRIILRFPLLKYIYPSIKQVFEFFFSENEFAFKKVVLIEYPSKGVWSIGFVTNESPRECNEKTNEELWSVYVPSVPNPATGFMVLVSRKNIHVLKLSASEAMKIIISAGLLNPESAPLETQDKNNAV